MPIFECTVYRRVSDVTRAFLNIEADDEAQATAKLKALVADPEEVNQLEFEFWQCADEWAPDAYEINGTYYDIGTKEATCDQSTG